MDYPIYIDGRKSGALTVTRQSGAVLISARLADPGRVVRLTVYGEREAYLGVPEPGDGMLRLEKRLTGAAAEAFPQNPRYAAEHVIENPEAPKRHVIWHGGRPHYF